MKKPRTMAGLGNVHGQMRRAETRETVKPIRDLISRRCSRQAQAHHQLPINHLACLQKAFRSI